MKTIFKEEMKVYDSLNFPGEEGIIKEIKKDKYEGVYPIIVKFQRGDEDNGVESYTLEGSYKKDCIPTLSTKPYEIELKGFEQKTPSPTFEEAWNYTKNVYIDKIGNFKKYEGYPSQELANAFEALRKLIFLRDYYNGNWKPDWNNSDIFKYCIEIYRGNIESMNYNTTYKIMFFKTSEIRDRFFEEQIKLLEIAKPLL